ncbi:glycosyltransferase family 4 protein [Microbacterium enclense]|uniref:glycosyltransferase family 4 protein n=1 Tax=Microbacterium enclense TaxID=993073 RepID=UPI003F7FDFEF
MKILIASHKFAPDIGGIETMSELLANYFTANGHEVTVVTHTTRHDDRARDFTVLRKPGVRGLWRVSRSVDVVFHNNICMRFAWPQMFLRKPWVIAVRTWITRNSGQVGLRDRAKQRVLRRASVIAISHEVARHLRQEDVVVIPNGYRDELFTPGERRDRDPRDVVFVGRLVEAKGVQVLLEALAALPPDVTLDIVGRGPYEDTLRQIVVDRGLNDRVRFLGQLQGDALVLALRGRGTLVVPSLWNEPFGIVALEGMAAGCWVIASEGGGLSEAVGTAGLTFPNGDAQALAARLTQLIEDSTLRDRLAAAAVDHLAGHTTSAMASRYLEVVRAAGGAS